MENVYETCTSCLQIIDENDLVVAPCGHPFHIDCFNKELISDCTEYRKN